MADLAMNGKDCADARIDVDIGRSIERIEHQNVIAMRSTRRNRNDALGLFRRHDADMAAVSHGPIDRLLRKLVELLNLFTLNIDLARFAKDLDESGLIHL